MRQISQADVAICVEVAEHLPAQYADPLAYNITHSTPVHVFSAATADQGRYEHVNEQPKPYWTEKLESHGFQEDRLRTFAPRHTLRFRIRQCMWLARNMFYLRRSSTTAKPVCDDVSDSNPQ